jgi:hypothetical protein
VVIYSSKDWTHISKDNERAIIDALLQKTISQDTIFELIFKGEQKYVSNLAAPHMTIILHTKDVEELIEAEKEAFRDLAACRTTSI